MRTIDRNTGAVVLELLLAVLVISIGGAALVEAIQFSHAANKKAQYIQLATAAAQSAVEDNRALGSSMVTGITTSTGTVSSMPANTALKVTILNDATRTGLRDVKAEVTWTAGGYREAVSGYVCEESQVYAP